MAPPCAFSCSVLAPNALAASCSHSRAAQRQILISGRLPEWPVCASRRRAHSAAAAEVTTRRGGAASAAADSLEAAACLVQDFFVEHELPQGRLVVRPVQPDDIGAASVLLTRAFATSLQGVPLQDGRQYCLECLKQPPLGVLLVARLHPEDPSLLPPKQSSRVVATTGLSFCRSTRENFPSLQPPDDAAYLSNMAVDTKLRRRGIARLMLQAAEALAAVRGVPSIYLHARLGDTPAQSLYAAAGYCTVDQDAALLAKLRGITPRALMKKNMQ